MVSIQIIYKIHPGTGDNFVIGVDEMCGIYECELTQLLSVEID